MTLIEVDIPEIIPAEILAVLDESVIQEIIALLANKARNHWLGLADKDLHTSRNDYKDSIQNVELMPGMAVISLVGQPANIIENGLGVVDLREWLLGARVPVAPFGQRGKRQHSSGEGFYRAVPFRHQTPGTQGTGAPRMGDPYRGHVDDAEAIGRKVYNAARKLKPTKMTSEGPRAVGEGPEDERLPRLPAGLAPTLKSWQGVEHKTDIYAGMIRQEAAYQEKVQAAYMTFRTISTRVPEGWIRPPTQARHFAKRTAQWVARMAPKEFQKYVDGINKARSQ